LLYITVRRQESGENFFDDLGCDGYEDEYNVTDKEKRVFDKSCEIDDDPPKKRRKI